MSDPEKVFTEVSYTIPVAILLRFLADFAELEVSPSCRIEMTYVYTPGQGGLASRNVTLMAKKGSTQSDLLLKSVKDGMLNFWYKGFLVSVQE